MSHWKSLNFIYQYDNTFEGLLTTISYCYENKLYPFDIKSEFEFQDNLLIPHKKINTDLHIAKIFAETILKEVSEAVLHDAFNAFLSHSQNKEIIIFKYLILSLKVGSKITTMLSIDYVLEIRKLNKKVLGEAHRLKGLVRFINIADNLFYSSIHPDNNVIENVGNHFVSRLKNQNFILHDKIRNLAFVYNQKEYRILDVKNLQLPSLSEEEKQYQKLWKSFYQTIAIKERKNPRLQAAYMPRRYWKDLVEMN